MQMKLLIVSDKNLNTTLSERLARRLATQQGGRGKIVRHCIYSELQTGRSFLPSGSGRQITVTASI